MINSSLVYYPCFSLVLITMIVWMKLLYDRIQELRVRQIHPQTLSTRNQITQTLSNLKSADNFKNLFELPVLFYVLCLALQREQTTTPLMFFLAWIFVIGRGLHSFIQCTYNKVTHRFWAYLLSSFILFLMWVLFGLSFAF